MDNGQTKEQPMADEAMKAMVDRIREEHWPDFDNAALAAIIETQELCAALAEDFSDEGMIDPGGIGWHIAAAIRSGQQFRKDV